MYYIRLRVLVSTSVRRPPQSGRAIFIILFHSYKEIYHARNLSYQIDPYLIPLKHAFLLCFFRTQSLVTAP